MTPQDFDRIEKDLGITLPTAYRKVMTDFPAEILERPPETPAAEDFLLDVQEILKAQKAARKRLGRALPPGSFIFGKADANFWLVDARSDDPPVKLVFDGMVLDGPANLAELLEQVRTNHRDAWEKHRRRIEAGAEAALTADDLIAEARRLSRPAVLLVDDEGDAPLALWKGTGVVPPPEGEWEHWISIAAEHLPANPGRRTGVVSVYLCVEDSDRFHEVAVVHDAAASLPGDADGQPLIGRPFDCPPTLETLLKFGSERIQKWLQAQSVDPDHGVNPQSFDAAGREALKGCARAIEFEHPFAAGEAYAMLGGWSMCFLWCYGIDEAYPWEVFDSALVVLTLRDSEPWLEVFDDGKEFRTFSRIT